jgi:hypothetical protein
MKLELQRPMPAIAHVAAKALVLAAGWLISSTPVLVAIALWRSYGGTLYPPEFGSLALGHMLNAGLTIGLAASMAAIAEHPSTAAILTLSVTVGTWIVNFVAAVNGGWWERAAAITPTSMVAEFQHGLVRLDLVAVAAIVTAAGLALAAIWLRSGVAVRRRGMESGVLAAATAALLVGSFFIRPSWDLSENRANSFSRADESALRQIQHALRIEVHLAPEDPRRFDLERRALKRLRRIVPRLDVVYISSTSIGLFEQTNPHYGEIWYELDGRRVMSRLTTEEGVLEALYGLAHVTAPVEPETSEFRGHPLAVPPRGAAWVFYVVWPAVVVAAAVLVQRRRR